MQKTVLVKTCDILPVSQFKAKLRYIERLPTITELVISPYPTISQQLFGAKKLSFVGDRSGFLMKFLQVVCNSDHKILPSTQQPHHLMVPLLFSFGIVALGFWPELMNRIINRSQLKTIVDYCFPNSSLTARPIFSNVTGFFIYWPAPNFWASFTSSV